METAFDYNFVCEVVRKVRKIEYSYSGIERMEFQDNFCVLKFDNEYNRDCFYNEFDSYDEFNVKKFTSNTFLIFRGES